AHALLRGEELAPARIVDRGDDGLSAALEGARAAEDGEAVRVVRRPVDGIEDPAQLRFVLAIAAGFELLGEHRMIGEPLGDERPEHALDVAIDLRDEIDRPFFLDVEIVHAGHLHLAGLDGRLHRGREENRGRRFSHPPASFFTMRTSMPPSGARFSCTSSMKLRMKKMPRPLDLRMFSGWRGSATSSGSNPSPSSRTRTTSSVGASRGVKANSIVTRLVGCSRLPCLMALMTDSRTATPIQ